MDEVKKYIAFRFQNWLDYARHMARVHHFDGWADDLLNDVILNLLQKPEEKLKGLLSRKTKKIVNGRPTTELDKFVLSMLKLNACSPVAPFRKNTLGNKIIARPAPRKVKTCIKTELNGFDCEAETYNPEIDPRLDKMHHANIERLKSNDFSPVLIHLYKMHFIASRPLEFFTRREQKEIDFISKFLTNKKRTLLDV